MRRYVAAAAAAAARRAGGPTCVQARLARQRAGSADAGYGADAAAEDVEHAIVMRESCEQFVNEYEGHGRNEEDDILLYDSKPLYVVAEEKSDGGGMILRNYWHLAMWGVPSTYRDTRGFMHRGRLAAMQEMLERIYSIDFQAMSGSEYMEELRRLKSEPMVRPKIAALLNPQFARTLLNYFMRQMKKLNMPRLIIYELAGTNGQTALGVLDILEEEFPEIYASCEYHMIDICGPWMTHRDAIIKAHHYDHYFEHHISIFDWDVVVPERVFFVCLEILSYLPMDKIEIHNQGGFARETLSDKKTFWETGIQEAEFQDKRKDPYFWMRYSRYKAHLWHRPLQDPLIMQYLQSVDFDGRFTPEALAQNEYDIAQGGTLRGHDLHVFKERNLTPRSWLKAGDGVGATRHVLGLEDNEFWVPSLLVPFCDKLRRCFPRHTLFVLDQMGMHTHIPGNHAPVLRQYALGQIYEIKTIHQHEGSLGVTEFRQNFDFKGFRKLYYDMMQLPPSHPLHLRCMDVRSFFEDYSTDDVRETLMHPDKSVDQPVDSFYGARILCAEFGGDPDEVGDSPKDAAATFHHLRQRNYDRLFWALEKAQLIAPESKYNLASRSFDVAQVQTIDTGPVLEAIGPNPTPEQLDVPVGYYLRRKEEARVLEEATARAAGHHVEGSAPNAEQLRQIPAEKAREDDPSPSGDAAVRGDGGDRQPGADPRD